MNEVYSSNLNKNDSTSIYTHFQVGAEKRNLADEEVETKKCCAIHPEYPPFYICTTCESLFCRFCPKSLGGGLKSCPFCGGQCVLYYADSAEFKAPEHSKYDDYLNEKTEPEKAVNTVYPKLNLTDFLAAMKYPFNFPISFLIGAILFSVLVFGQILAAFSGGWTAAAAVMIGIIILMLKFGVFFKTVENFTQANFQNSFLPRVKKFAIWEDFFSPLIMGIGVYIMTFGLFMVIAISLGFYAWYSFAENTETIEDEMRRKGNQINSTLSSNSPDKNLSASREIELREMIDQAKLRQFESVFGHNHLLESEQLGKLVKSVTNLTLTFQMPLLFAFIFGFLYFPAVCLTLKKTRSFGEILDIKAGFREIRKLGFDYLKIVLMGFGFIIALLAVVAGLYSAFEYLEIPIVGIFSALIAGSFLFFYFWLVSSGILGIVVCKRTESI